VLIVTLALSLVPTPYYVVAPGNAVDLSTRLFVEGRPPPQRRFYLTDVSVVRASVVLLAAGLWPGVRIVYRDTIVPPGVTAGGFDRLMVDAMGDSQNAAAIVAERAAGYHVAEPPQSIVVGDVLAASHAAGVLAPGDTIARVGNVAIRRMTDLATAFAGVRPGSPVTVGFVRAGRSRSARIVTIAGPHGARLGVAVRVLSARAQLPVPVRYLMGGIAGSSGGLMFALDIYAGLRPGHARGSVAGTGTIASDGRVGPIEGVAQKLIAARRVGAELFLVPKENYASVAHETGIRVVPVATFREALAAIGD